jgi:hypothetical protein
LETKDFLNRKEFTMERRDNNLNRDKHLFRLGELNDYKVASGDPDVRGWTIVDRDNREFGTIDELIVDPNQEKARYLDVVPSRERAAGGEDHLLIPIGVARIDDSDNRVIVREINSELLNSYPPHRGDAITRDYEYEIVERFNRPDGTTAATRHEGTDFYNSEIYNEDRFYTNRNRNRSSL